MVKRPRIWLNPQSKRPKTSVTVHVFHKERRYVPPNWLTQYSVHIKSVYSVQWGLISPSQCKLNQFYVSPHTIVFSSFRKFSPDRRLTMIKSMARSALGRRDGRRWWSEAAPPRPQRRSSNELISLSLSPCLSLICPFLGEEVVPGSHNLFNAKIERVRPTHLTPQPRPNGSKPKLAAKHCISPKSIWSTCNLTSHFPIIQIQLYVRSWCDGSGDCLALLLCQCQLKVS